MDAPDPLADAIGLDYAELRPEDRRLLTGGGQYIADIILAGQAYGSFLRAPHAHARILSIDTEAARAAPGVLAVLTAEDVNACGFGGLPPPPQLKPGAPFPYWPALAEGCVIHIGQTIALVVAETRLAAEEAGELIEVEYEPLPALVDTAKLFDAASPQLYPDIPGNLVYEVTPPLSDPAGVAAAMESAAHIASLTLLNTRVAVASLDTRGANAIYQDGRYTLYSCSQSATTLRNGIMGATKLTPDTLRVLTFDVGGAFGMKTPCYPEYVALLAAAKLTGRPVQWISTRQEAFLCDSQARDNVFTARLAMNAEGDFLALECDSIANVGAFLIGGGLGGNTNNFPTCLTNMYRWGAMAVRVRCGLSNSIPINAYRGAGRPEAAYVVERLIEEVSRLSGIDAVELRRRNLVPAAAIPYTIRFGQVIDSGDFPGLFDDALAHSDHAGFPARRDEATRRGRLRGRGFANFVEVSGAGGTKEAAELRLAEDGNFVAYLGGQDTGQAHRGTYARLLAAQLGVPVSRLRLVRGDTARFDASASPSAASRSMQSIGSAIARTSTVLIEQAKEAAARKFEVSASDVVWDAGRLSVSGTDIAIDLFDLAQWSGAGEARRSTLDAKAEITMVTAYPNGCHVAEVEIDPETGRVWVPAYWAVDDAGVVLEPVIVEAQVQGGVAQGMGQALGEQVLFDRETGQLLNGSFMDYPMPRADEVPEVHGIFHNTACTTNLIGAKGAGEAGTVGAITAVMNAVNDALGQVGAAAIDMPATPERVWRALAGR